MLNQTKGGFSMPYQYKKLKGRIIEKYGSHKNFAKALGKSSNSVSRKLNCKTGFSQKDIHEWSALLNIAEGEYNEYFFT